MLWVLLLLFYKHTLGQTPQAAQALQHAVAHGGSLALLCSLAPSVPCVGFRHGHSCP